MELVATYRAHVEHLGWTADVRRFLAAILLTTRHHLSTRPISGANTSFAERLATSSDALLAVLRDPRWERLDDAGAEQGLAELRALADLPGHRDTPDGFRRIYKHRLGAMNPPWSLLAPVDGGVIERWPAPREILLAIGPNIGIGDELIYFEVARRMLRRWPGVAIHVSSSAAGLWELCAGIATSTTPGPDQLQPFVTAIERIRAAPDTLVVFAEFASTPIYRMLEQVASLPRFVYLDTGARTVRTVDRERGVVLDHVDSIDGGVYAILDRLLAKIGLSDGAPAAAWPAVPARRRIREPATIFVNPFSSKEYRVLAPGWWSSALSTLAGRGAHARIFGGINDECRAYARTIGEACTIEATVMGEREVPSIGDTLRGAAESDVVFGLDTFTAHVGVIAPTPCVTVFFGSAWDPWRVRNNHVLNTHVLADPAAAGALLRRLLEVPGPEAIEHARAIVEATDAARTGRDVLASVHAVFAAVARWAAIDGELARDFVDVPPAFAHGARSALERAAARDVHGTAVERLTRDVADTWMGSNLLRYARYLAG